MGGSHFLRWIENTPLHEALLDCVQRIVTGMLCRNFSGPPVSHWFHPLRSYFLGLLSRIQTPGPRLHNSRALVARFLIEIVCACVSYVWEVS